MYGYIYITTNLINGRKYIGQKKSSKFNESYKGSGKLLKNAIEKYGINNFETHILEEINNVPTICNSKEELDKSEYYYIEYYDAVNSYEFYNLKHGGEGGSNKGYICLTSPLGEHKRMFVTDIQSYLDDGWIIKGPIPTEETKQKRANSNRGQKRSEETKLKISKSLTGVKRGPLSEEHRIKVGEAGKYNQPKMKPIRCIETGDEFISLG